VLLTVRKTVTRKFISAWNKILCIC